MEEVFLRFVHLAENIFDLLDAKTVAKCHKVGKSWNSFIQDKNLMWIKIIKNYDAKTNKNHTNCQQKWRKLFQKTNGED